MLVSDLIELKRCLKRTFGIVVDYRTVWNSSTLEGVCSSSCESSIQQLADAVTIGCGSETFALNGQNMLYTDLIDHIQYKLGLICLTDDASGEYCIEVEDK